MFKGSLSFRSSQILIFHLFDNNNSDRYKVTFIAVLICIALMISDIELFWNVSADHLPFFFCKMCKRLGLFNSLLLSCAPHTESSSLSCKSSLPFHKLPLLSVVSSALMQSCLSIFGFVALVLGIKSKTSLPRTMSRSFRENLSCIWANGWCR